MTAVDLDTGNNARLTYRLVGTSHEFGVFPNSGWVYLRGNLDRERQDSYRLQVAAMDNGSPPATATTLVSVTVTDANDNDPIFAEERYSWYVEENLSRGAVVGRLKASDPDLGQNADVTFSIIPSNSSFQVDPLTGQCAPVSILLIIFLANNRDR